MPYDKLTLVGGLDHIGPDLLSAPAGLPLPRHRLTLWATDAFLPYNVRRGAGPKTPKRVHLLRLMCVCREVLRIRHARFGTLVGSFWPPRSPALRVACLDGGRRTASAADAVLFRCAPPHHACSMGVLSGSGQQEASLRDGNSVHHRHVPADVRVPAGDNGTCAQRIHAVRTCT